MAFRFISRPVSTDRSAYDSAISNAVSGLLQVQGLRTVYRFGNITTPGVSDIDLLAVFEDDAASSMTGFENFNPRHSHLFTHGIMALSRSHFIKNNHFTIWSNYIYAGGIKEEGNINDSRTDSETQSLKVQTALEFIIANYIDLELQRTYKTFKLRSLLQHMKGLIYDLEFLSIREGNVYELLLEMRQISLRWFDEMPTDSKIEKWILHFMKEYNLFCKKLFEKESVFLPDEGPFTIAKNVRLVSSPFRDYLHRGIILPRFLSFGKKFFNLQNRLNGFEFYFPVKHNADDIVRDRFLFLREMKAYNKKNLPGFMTITTSLLSKII